MKKRFVSLLACGVLTVSAVAGLTACGDSGLKLTVWGPQAQQETLKQMVAKFEEANPETKYDITIGVCGENNALAEVKKAPSSAADVYAYSNDQIASLVSNGLAEIGSQSVFYQTVAAENSEDSVEAATFNGKLYGYPYASDNGCFMYYNKSILNDEDVKTLEGVIAKCEAAGKKIGWALDDSWYAAGFFFAFGCSYEVTYDSNGKESSISCDFDSEGGIKASKAMAKLANSSAFAGKGTGDDTIIQNFESGTYAVAVSGTWNAKNIQRLLGNNYGICKLPTVTIDEGKSTEETVQISSFRGYKMYGVNSHSKNIVEAHKLAQFLSNAEMQELRFDNHNIGPTNKTVAELDKVKTNETLAVLNAQNAFAVEQKSVPSNFWNPLDTYGGYIIDKLAVENPTSDKIYSYQVALNMIVGQIKNSII